MGLYTILGPIPLHYNSHTTCDEDVSFVPRLSGSLLVGAAGADGSLLASI